MDTESISMMLETAAMARESVEDVINPPAGSLFEDAGDDDDALHQVAVGAYETVKMTAEFTECDLVTALCEDLSSDFFEFKYDGATTISASRGKEFLEWLKALEDYLENNTSTAAIDRLLQPLQLSNRQKYQELFGQFADVAVSDDTVGVDVDRNESAQSGLAEDAGFEDLSSRNPDLSSHGEQVDSIIESIDSGSGDFDEVADGPEYLNPVSNDMSGPNEESTDKLLEDLSAAKSVLSELNEEQSSSSAVIATYIDTVEEETTASNDGLEAIDLETGSLADIDDPDNQQAVVSSESTADSLDLGDDQSVSDSIIEDTDQPASEDQDKNVFSSAIEQEVVEMLLEELDDLTDDLSDSQGKMFDSVTLAESREAAATDYAKQLAKLVEAYDTMGCAGLARATEFVIENTEQVVALEPENRDQAGQVFNQWPKLFAQYLGSASREQDALEILVCYQSADWPKPMSESAGDDLYVALIEEFNLAATKQNEEPRLETATATDVDLAIDADVSANVMQSFLQEAPDLASQFTHTMLGLPESADLQTDLKTGQRTIHTIKGLATLVGVNGITNLSHNIEDILEYLMSTRVSPPGELYEVLADSADTLESMLDHLAGQGSSPDNAQSVLNDVLAWARLCDEDRLDGFDGQLESGTKQPDTLSVEDDRADAGSLESDPEQSADHAEESGFVEDNVKPEADTGIAPPVEKTTPLQQLSEEIASVTELSSIPVPDNMATEPAIADHKSTGPEETRVEQSETSPVEPAIVERQSAVTAPLVPQLRRVTVESTVAEQSENRVDGSNLTVPVLTVDQLFRAVGEMSVLIGQMQVQVNRVIGQSAEIRKQRRVTEQRQFDLENVIDVQTAHAARGRVDMDKSEATTELDALEFDQYGALHSTSHAYIETVADIQSMVNGVEKESTALRNLVDSQSQLNKMLEELVTSTRLVATSSLSARMERCVRQASRSTGKKVALNLVGTETLVDSETLNQLVNPLIHVLRNAVDHGIDDAAERIRAGKDAEGQIELSFRSDGQTISITCDDDGRGIDYEAIRNNMIGNGVIDESEFPENAKLVNYLFLPGVTTKSQATQLSGRGFGMDIVSESVRAMNGKLEMTDNEKGGCRVLIQIPVKLVTTHALLVEVSGSQFSIPSPFIEQVISLSMGNVETVGKELTFFYGNRAYPVINLSEKLQLPAVRPRKGLSSSVLIVNSGAENIAVVVDHVIGNHEVVVKSLGKYLSGAFDQVSGVATLGDGTLVTVLNMSSLLLEKAEPSPQSAATQSAATDSPHAKAGEVIGQAGVLIVEDSLSVRNALADIVEDAGYSPVLAKDGIQALELLKTEPIGIVLTDLEMPRMDGLELTKQIRSSETHNALPVLMITSRTMEKHMQLANAAGVTEYITKPFSENRILDLVSENIVKHAG